MEDNSDKCEYCDDTGYICTDDFLGDLAICIYCDSYEKRQQLLWEDREPDEVE